MTGNNWTEHFYEPHTNAHITFNPHNLPVGVNPDLIETLSLASPFTFFSLFFDEEIINLLVVETNKYANDKLSEPGLSRNARLRKWKDVDKTEIKKLFGIIMWMGLVKMPCISNYWSTNKLYNSYISSYMSRNRFELLLSMLHVSDNSKARPDDRLYKIQPLIDLLVHKYNSALIPEQNVCIDESIVPFKGRLKFRQFISNKRHRYGIKIFKLCTRDFYTSQYKVYAGKEATPGQSVSSKVVMELMEPYLDSGRVLFADNWYNSVDMAEKLLCRNTHLVGTLRANRKRNPTGVTKKKISKGETVAKINNKGVTVLKWKDKREVLMISTKHTNKIISVDRSRKTVKQKPEVVVDYNTGKGYINLTDQLQSYHSALRKSLKWYRKIIIDLICNISVLNALSLFIGVSGQKMKIMKFREAIIEELLRNDDEDTQQSELIQPLPTLDHTLEKSPKTSRCKSCYSLLEDKLHKKKNKKDQNKM
ncbi:piggyBac transposable element-derived protein 4-like [Sipha flava]|uniref:PiggyBac transposable element-derived protein 4-like n=1 Tax=Sipha flava TaxID=143950 RepID=A0A8B8GT77_9HEMI|nr:piggyBac transposable element-derived protein 4-like [Sipha flava]